MVWKRRLRSPFASCFLTLVLTLTATNGCKRGAAMIELDDAAAGQPVTIPIGQRLQITLSENRTTGYVWQLAPDCDRMLAMEQDETKAPSGPPGAGGTRTWIFQAQAEGNCTLRFESRRSWQKEATGKTVAFPVTVQKSA